MAMVISYVICMAGIDLVLLVGLLPQYSTRVLLFNTNPKGAESMTDVAPIIV